MGEGREGDQGEPLGGGERGWEVGGWTAGREGACDVGKGLEEGDAGPIWKTVKMVRVVAGLGEPRAVHLRNGGQFC